LVLHQTIRLPSEKTYISEILLKRGHKRILMVAGKMSSLKENTGYYVGAIKTIYSAN
jgi:hypothetical protein